MEDLPTGAVDSLETVAAGLGIPLTRPNSGVVARGLEGFHGRTQGHLTSLVKAVEATWTWTVAHSRRVADLASRIGSAMGLSRPGLDTLRQAALLHDIGKIGIPPSILQKPARLTRKELLCVAEHPHLGACILEATGARRETVAIVLQHHEQFGGLGYPQGLVAEAIHPGARILAVADVFDALAHERPYRTTWGRRDACCFVKAGAGRQFDPVVVEAFLDMAMPQEDPVTESTIAETCRWKKPAPVLSLAA